MARNSADQKLYAVKIFNDLEDMETEIKNMSLVRECSNVVSLYHFSPGEECRLKTMTVIRPYIVLSLALGGNLYDFIATGAFPERVARWYFRQLITGLSCMHSKGVYHRDLKPENILIDEDLNLLITDFGYAKNDEEMKDGITRTNLGSEGYKSPEFYLRIPYSPASTDLFAAGAILFILMAGHPAFKAAKITDAWYKLI
jgi:serine/threonine protein kinase